MAATVSSTLEEKQDSVNDLIEEAVRLGMQFGFREPILEAVETSRGSIDETIQEEVTDDDQSNSNRTKALQGIGVFLVMFVVLYLAMRRMNADES